MSDQQPRPGREASVSGVVRPDGRVETFDVTNFDDGPTPDPIVIGGQDVQYPLTSQLPLPTLGQGATGHARGHTHSGSQGTLTLGNEDDDTIKEVMLGAAYRKAINALVDARVCLLVDCLIADAEEAALVRAVLLAEKDADLVYADWLEEKGRTEQAWRVRYPGRVVKG